MKKTLLKWTENAIDYIINVIETLLRGSQYLREKV